MIVVAGLEAPKENVVGRTFGFVALAAEAKDTDAKGFDLVAGVDDLSGVAEAAEEGARTGPLPLENCLRLPIHRYKMGPKMVTWLEQIKISQIQKKKFVARNKDQASVPVVQEICFYNATYLDTRMMRRFLRTSALAVWNPS